jgi:hypothetical protein
LRDAAGHTYVIGSYNGTIAVDVYDMSTTSEYGRMRFRLPTTQGNSVVVLKFDPSGVASSWMLVDGTAADAGNGACVDSFSNLTLVGSVTSTDAIAVRDMSPMNAAGPTLFNLPATSSTDAFVVCIPSTAVPPDYIANELLAPATLTGSEAVSRQLATFFRNSSNVRYDVESPYPSFALTTDGALTTTGQKRGTTYDVSVTATNKAGRSTSTRMAVTEAPYAAQPAAYAVMRTDTVLLICFENTC